jgi:cell division septation protein DedD
MRGVFDERDVEPAATQQHTELTLGPTTLLLIFFGLVLLCGLCVGLGYSMGHRGPDAADAIALPGVTPSTVHADSSRSKPAADPSSQSASTSNSAPAMAESSIASTGQTSPSEPSKAPGWVVKPALGASSNPDQPDGQAGSADTSEQAPSGTLMVQIAAIAQSEDADVLMSALRKRGYAVVSRREPMDGLIHVRVGPFKTREEADRWRQKLLNDGYNAIVQP